MISFISTLVAFFLLSSVAMAQESLFDLRALHTPAKDQGNSDTCAFYAISGALENAIKISFGVEVDISEKHEWHRSKVIKQQRPEVEFGDTYLLAQNLTQDGSFQTEAGESYRFSGLRYTELTQLWVKTPWSLQIIEQISKKRSVVLTLKVATQEINDRAGEIRYTAETDTLCQQQKLTCGGHAVVIAGYDLQSKTFLIKNSWGQRWGEQGFGRVSFEHVDQFSFDHIVLYFDKMYSPFLKKN